MTRTLPVRARNQWFQRVETLTRNRNKRHRERLFVVEGVRPINALVRATSWPIEAFLYVPERGPSDWAGGVLEQSRAAYHLELSGELMDELSDKDDPSELLAVARIPEDDPGRLRESTPSLHLLMDRPARPGNLGTLIRSADALGADGMVIFGHAADVYDPRTVRASAGSLFSLPVIRLPAWGSLRNWLEALRARRPDLQVIGSSAHRGEHPDAVELSRSTVLVLGNEHDGLGHDVADACDAHVSMPMEGSASSLNVACAGTVLLWEARRQRRTT